MILLIYNWLKNNRLWNILLAFSYYLLVVLPHEEIGVWVTQTLDQPYGRDKYNLIILVLGLIGLFGYLLLVQKGIKALKKGKGLVWFAFMMTLLFIIISFNTLLTVNVEIIHFVQYALLAILLFPLLNNYRDTLFYATIFAIIDEGHQYLVLAPLRTDYFDFNDVIIDLIGATLGLLLFWISGLKDTMTNQKWYQTPTFIGFFLVTSIVAVTYFTNILAIYPSEAVKQVPILLVREIQENFWTIAYPNIKFHVVRPFEGALILTLLFYFYVRHVFGRPLNLSKI